MDCIFCKIASGQVPAKMVHQDDTCVAFMDIEPRSPVHLLVIPRKHIVSLTEIRMADEPLMGHLLRVTAELAAAHKLEGGFRVVINSGPDGGQTLNHLHVHLLGGRAMHWPPG